MTTQNGVLRFFARWVMRVEACRGVLQLGLFGGTFLTTGLTALHQYGHSEYARPFIAFVGLGTLLFAYVYTETGVWNQKNQFSKDKGTNYGGPNLLMRYRMQAAQRAVLVRAINEDWSPERVQEELDRVTLAQWATLRTGIDEELLDGAAPDMPEEPTMATNTYGDT